MAEDKAEAKMEWLPIEDAPKDGIFLVYDGGAMRTMWRHKGEWQHLAYAAIVSEYGDNIVGKDAERITGGRRLKVCDCIYAPTHYMPLPAAPEKSA